MKFIGEVLFKHWSVFDFVISLASFIVFAFEGLTPSKRLVIIIAGISLGFIIKLVRQCYTYYQGYLKPIKVLGSIKGVGVDKARTFVRIKNLTYLRPEMLLTLSTNGNGVQQDLCVIQVVTSDEGQDCICATLNAEDQKLVNTYCVDGNKLSNLYALPTINRPDLLGFEK